jgi:MFS superfamily sulfate permease-like transporter
VLILNMTNVDAIDATGLYALDELRRRCRKDATRLILAGTHAQPIFKLTEQGLLDEFGEENLAGTIAEALELVHRQLDLDGTVSLPGRDAVPGG